MGVASGTRERNRVLRPKQEWSDFVPQSRASRASEDAMEQSTAGGVLNRYSEKEPAVHSIFYIIGVVVVVLFVLSFLGLA